MLTALMIGLMRRPGGGPAAGEGTPFPPLRQLPPTPQSDGSAPRSLSLSSPPHLTRGAQ
jgi:hypothetical protein